MTRSLLVAASAAIALSTPAAAQQAQPPASAPTTPSAEADAAVDWRAAARQDVLAAYDIYVENHPGTYDPQNPQFRQKLARARDRGLAVADRAANRSDYIEALGAFSAELSDGHAQAFARSRPAAAAAPREWPGFVAAWRGQGVIVHHAGSHSPAPAGSSVVSCDGENMDAVMRRRLLVRGFRPAEAGHWWMRAPQAFVSSPIFTAARPTNCLFRRPDGGETQAELTWSPVPEDFDELVRVATDGERTAIGLNEPRPDVFLIGMPTFQPNAEEVAAYRALYDAVTQRRAELMRARAIIIDLRHNDGGSSTWSRQLAQRLWGEELVERAMADYFRNIEIWWRASGGNIAHMGEMASRIRSNGNGALADRMLAFGEGMRTALARGEPFYVQPRSIPPTTAPAGAAPAPDLMVPVYVITPGRCASACLDAVDIFTRFSNTRLIGAPTSGDSSYMEARSQDLPSGQGTIVIPTKIWMGRPRASGEVYSPHILVQDRDWSTGVFLDRIERDLTPAPDPNPSLGRRHGGSHR